MKTLPVHERFSTFQGEGVNMGRGAFFIRLFGCPLHCPFCDAAGTWHPQWKPKAIDRFAVDQLADEAAASGQELVVLTGGEPAIHDTSELTKALLNNGQELAIETSGHFGLTNTFDFRTMTVSPKRAGLPLHPDCGFATEFKLIIETPSDIAYWFDVIAPFTPDTVWLHPEWSHRTDPAVLNAITKATQRDPRVRAGWQLHKLYQSDQQDPRATQLAPLGGDPSKGY